MVDKLSKYLEKKKKPYLKQVMKDLDLKEYEIYGLVEVLKREGYLYDIIDGKITKVKPLKEKGIYLACQCCEHLNRAIIIEKEAAKKYGYEIVSVVPQPKAGGSFATTAYKNFENPVALENVKADAGLDIGLTLIGMHLKRVAVPLRLSLKSIGEATICAARTRPKFIGGIRAQYNDSLIG